MEYNKTALFSCVRAKGLGKTMGCNFPGFNISRVVLNVLRSDIILITTFSQCLTNKL